MLQRFYRIEGDRALTCDAAVPPEARLVIWQAADGNAPPREVASPSLLVWRVFDRLGLFANRNFGIVAIVRGEQVLHRLVVTPRWYRFPFMAVDDLQLGGLETAESERGRGLARAALVAAHRHFAGRYAAMWYVVDDANAASCRVAEACGYDLVGYGERTAPLGLRPLGRFVIRRRA